jgi:DNA-binding IscR family transcriptional regulator
MVTRASVRSLAAMLGLNKDTVGRALARLRHAELVVHVKGRFEVGAYRLTVPAEVIRFNRATPEHASRRSARQCGSSGVQLALIASE